ITGSNSGGGIVNYGFLQVNDSKITGNVSNQNGGGIANMGGGSINLIDSQVSGNSSAGSGGGVYNQGAIAINNCTFSANSAGSGAAFYDAANSTYADVANSILWADTGGEIVNQGTITVEYSDVQGWTGPGAGNLGPNVNPSFDSNLLLQNGSACINTGNNSYVVAGLKDLAGNTR